MKPPLIRLYDGEIIVDSFAGGGGASLGIEMALGRSPDIAINHDAEAIAMHARNHPGTRHYCEDVWKVSPREAVGDRPVGLMWLSPDCKHFSKAKGGKPVEKKIRGLAWVAYRWAKEVRPRVIALENVEEFVTWGPIGTDGKPCPLRKGFTFRRFVAMLSNLGYTVDWRELVAADYGAPTTRKRLFLIARCDGQSIVWPEPTHAPKGRHGLLPWRAAAECIDFTIRCPSIFLTKEEARAVGVKRPLAENTMRRIARGLQRFVLDNPAPFIVPMQHANAATDIEDPLQTVTTQGNKFNVVTPYVAKFRGDSAGSSIEAPLPTITAGPKENPAGAAHALGVITPYIVPLTHQGSDRVESIEDPMKTLTGAHRGERAVVVPYLAGVGGRKGQSPETSVEQPYHTITAKGDTVLVAPYAVPRYGEREGQDPRAISLEQPAPTIVPTQNGAQLVAAFMAQHNTDVVGHPVERPVSTIVGKGCTQGLVASTLVSLRGTNDGQLKGNSIEAPLPTISAGGWHAAEVRAFLIAYYGNEKDGGELKGPMRTVTSRDRMGLVTVKGEDYVVVDIGMRMLAPRELYRAQGFPDSYVIDMHFKGKPLPKDAQVRMVGNSVCPPLAAAIIRAQFAQAEEARIA